MAQPSTSAPLQPGAVFQDRYRIIRCLKAGGMGAVYEVVDTRTDSPRALKVMLPSIVEDPELRARFALEARVTGAIASDHIVKVLDAGIDDASGTPFLVMELLHGEELATLVKRRKALSGEEVALYLGQAALALDKTHAAGIVHRDLKPENLFMTYRDDGGPCVKILDFGIAKVVAQSTARATRAVGTPLYMSPEQIRGDGAVSPRADVYALGQIAYSLLVGEPYWLEEARASETMFPLLAAIVAGPPEPPSARARRRTGVQLSPSFDTWFAKCVAAHAPHRYERATAAVAALTEVLRAPIARVGSPSASSVEQQAVSALPAREIGISTPMAPGGAHTPARSGSTSAAVVSEPQRQPPSRTTLAVSFGLATVAVLAAGALVFINSHKPESGIAPARPPAPAASPSALELPITAPATASAPNPPIAAPSTSAQAPTPTSSVAASPPPRPSTSASVTPFNPTKNRPPPPPHADPAPPRGIY